jgi:PhoD-like phosphatase
LIEIKFFKKYESKLLKTSRRLIFLFSFLLMLGLTFASAGLYAVTTTFAGEELLGKPTNNSITINIVPDSTIEYYYEYGTTKGGPYPYQTSPVTATGGEPHEVVITGLDPNTRYYYRMIYDGDGDVDDGNYIERDEHTFHTQRAKGEDFTFTVTSDSHAIFNTAHRNAMTNILNDQPDFNIDLGDTFMSGNAVSQSAANSAYLAYRDPLYMDRIGHSVPIFLTAGNHEDEEGWNLDDYLFGPNYFSPAVGSIQARKAFYPTPIDDGFYSGNMDPLDTIDEATYGDNYREDYYAWTWGDALFVILDEYQYTMTNPYGTAAGEGSDDPDSGDQWNWTLGLEQYNWLKKTLENSNAKYKFVFSHHVTGGIARNIGGIDAGYVRGGAEAAKYFEWGGYNADGTSWGFSTKRSGWGVDAEHPNGTPIHQLFVDNGVDVYFHGHDHQYAYEISDGVVYQEVPSPSLPWGFSGVYIEGNYGDYRTIAVIPNNGHLRITVTPDEATVEYVRSNAPPSDLNGQVSYSYTIDSHEPENTCQCDIEPYESDGDVDGSDLVIWMGGSTGISLEDVAAEFGRTDCTITP